MLFEKLNEYDYWANQKILNIILENRDMEEEEYLFHHILEANLVWYSRLNQLPIDVKIFNDNYYKRDFQRRLDMNYQQLKGYLPNCKKEEVITYQNLKGDTYTSIQEDIIQHVYNHSTHHRAQILRILKEKGLPRPSLDYIFYCREINQ